MGVWVGVREGGGNGVGERERGEKCGLVGVGRG